MKFVKITSLVLLTAILSFSSCAKLDLGNIKTNVAASKEIVITPELKTLLQAIPMPKIVFRVLNPPTIVTVAERFNSFINEIEKEFVKKGYTVRDRALLENLMRSGSIDYQGIKDKIDTDLIIDILALSFDKSTISSKFFNQTTQKEEPFATAQTYVECGVATLECRVTIVDRGQLGGLFTLRTSPCDMNATDFYVDGFRQNMAWVGQEAMGMFPVIRYPIPDNDDIKRLFTQTLARQLIDVLSSQ